MSVSDDEVSLAYERQTPMTPPENFLEVLYGDDKSDGEEQEPSSYYEIDSDEYESEDPLALHFSPLPTSVRRADKVDSSLYLQHERSRSRSPLRRHQNILRELSNNIIIIDEMEQDRAPLDEPEMNFFVPDVHVSFDQTKSKSGRVLDPGRVRARGRGRGRARGRGQNVGNKGLQWDVGHPLQEIWLSDDDVPPELQQMARDVLRRRLNGRVNEEEPKEVVDGTDIPLYGEDLHFEWSPMETFRGKEEIFRPARIGAVESYKSAYDAFRSYWDDSILQIIADETNRYAKKINSPSFQDQWYNTNVHELLCLFAFWMMLGIIRMPTIQSCFTEHPLMKTQVFRHIFSYGRYSRLIRALHFADEEANFQTGDPTISDPAANFDRVYCLRPIVDHLNAKFQANYIPSQNICIGESPTRCNGTLDTQQDMPSKAAKFGIKVLELCESATGYLWSFILYTGKQTSAGSQRVPRSSTSFSLVKRLIGPLLNKGYRLFMNDWFNSPLLARFLKRNGTDCVGPLRSTLKDVPYLVAKAPLIRGQLLARHSGDVCVLAWEDTKRVTMISTYHGSGTGLPRIHTNPVRPIPFKPQVVLDYDASIGGVDLKDEMLEPYLVKRKRCNKWYMNIFNRLLNASILNARILLECSQNSRVNDLSFRLQIVDAILSRHLPQVPVPHKDPPSKSTRPAVGQFHWLSFVPKTERELRANRQARTRCTVCYSQGNRQKTTPFMCEVCQVPLCAVNCFKAYHIS